MDEKNIIIDTTPVNTIETSDNDKIITKPISTIDTYSDHSKEKKAND